MSSTEGGYSGMSRKRKCDRPPGLKGKEIGMYYAQRQRERREEQQKRPLGEIYLSEEKKQQIETMLNSIKHFSDAKGSSSYNHIKDSGFKRLFLSTITGSLENKLSSASLSMKRDSDFDMAAYKTQQEKYNQSAYKEMLNKRKKLPAFKMKDTLIEAINENQVVLISGETGCGKTTQVPQLILDHFIDKQQASVCKIICTQPRRICAIAVAERVADEKCEKLGQSVGYQIRLERELPRNRGSITYCTTGMVLRQMEGDPCLSDISHIILDEIHERDVMSDFLITLLKKVISIRKDLKVILMSATLNAESFSKYYNDCVHINIPGFTFPVKEYFLEDVLLRTHFVFSTEQPRYRSPRFSGKFRYSKQFDEFGSFIDPYIKKLSGKYPPKVLAQLRNPESEKLNLDLILELLINICETEKEEGAILVFVTGFVEISNLIKSMQKSGKFPTSKFLIIPLHSMMPTVEQRQIFETPPRGVRKIIVSTNISETSITIDDVVFVIDAGKIKISNFNPNNNTDTLEAEWVSQANANQRRGRAGRVKPGVCFHLYTKARYDRLKEYQLPEILRTRLECVILHAKVLQLGKVEPFFAELMDSPDPQAVEVSLDLLKRLNALDEEENLTPLGYHLARLPMNPQLGKMILFGAIFSCLDPILTIAAFLDYKDPFQLVLGKQKQADEMKKLLAGEIKSDHLLLVEILKKFEMDEHRKQFCWDYFMSFQTLRMIIELKRQFMDYLYELKFVDCTRAKATAFNMNSDNDSLIIAIVCAGLYPNVLLARPKKNRMDIRTLQGAKISVHPKSILLNEYLRSPLLVYFRKIKSSDTFVHDLTSVTPYPVIFFGDRFKQMAYKNKHIISIGDGLNFVCTKSTSNIIKSLRRRLNLFLEYKSSHPSVINWAENSDETILLRAIVELLVTNDVGDVDLEDFDRD